MRLRSRLATPCGVACLLLLPALIPAQDVAKKAVRPEAEVVKQAGGGNVEEIIKNVESLIRKPGDPPRPIEDVRAAAAPRIRANIDMIAQQQLSQLRPTLRAEYQLLVATCEPTKAARKAIAREGERALSEASKQAAEWQMGRRPIAQGTPPDPRVIIQDALAAAAGSHLSPDQAARYREERDKRAAYLKRTVLRNLVAKLDQSLFLSEEQFASIASALDANWEPAWSSSISLFINDNAYFFPIPDRLILPTLTESQKKAWAGLQKVQQNTSFALGFVANRGQDNVPLEDAEIDEPRDPKVMPPQLDPPAKK